VFAREPITGADTGYGSLVRLHAGQRLPEGEALSSALFAGGILVAGGLFISGALNTALAAGIAERVDPWITRSLYAVSVRIVDIVPFWIAAFAVRPPFSYSGVEYWPHGSAGLGWRWPPEHYSLRWRSSSREVSWAPAAPTPTSCFQPRLWPGSSFRA
jgi:hypothetical protein